jgi:hypothetical protein
MTALSSNQHMTVKAGNFMSSSTAVAPCLLSGVEVDKACPRFQSNLGGLLLIKKKLSS